MPDWIHVTARTYAPFPKVYRECSDCDSRGFANPAMFNRINDGSGWRFVCPTCIRTYDFDTSIVREPPYLIMEACGLPTP